MAEAKEDSGGEVDNEEMKVPLVAPVMAIPYTTTMEEVTESMAISGDTLDSTISARSRWAAVRESENRIVPGESASEKQKRIVLH